MHIEYNSKLFISIEDYINDNTSLYTPKFCYQAIGVPDYVTIPQNETGIQILHDFISFLNHYIIKFIFFTYSFSLDVSFSGMIQISSVSKTKYFSQFPFCFLLPWFDITSLPWYQNHLLKTSENEKEGFIFSPLNDFFITKIKEMSITSSLYSDGNMIGIIREGLIISDYLIQLILIQQIIIINQILFKNLNINSLFKIDILIKIFMQFIKFTIPTVPYNVLLLDQDGLVVYFNIEQLRNKTDYFYIYDQNVTGFNKTDWEGMIQFSSQREKVILVLENKLQDEKVNVYSLQVLKNNFTLIVYYYYL